MNQNGDIVGTSWHREIATTFPVNRERGRRRRTYQIGLESTPWFRHNHRHSLFRRIYACIGDVAITTIGTLAARFRSALPETLVETEYRSYSHLKSRIDRHEWGGINGPIRLRCLRIELSVIGRVPNSPTNRQFRLAVLVVRNVRSTWLAGQTLPLHRQRLQSDQTPMPFKLVTLNEPRLRASPYVRYRTGESRNLRRLMHRQSNCRDQLYAAVRLMPCTCRHARRYSMPRAIDRSSIVTGKIHFSGLLLLSSLRNPTAFSVILSSEERDERKPKIACHWFAAL